jgi:hypothetical protein
VLEDLIGDLEGSIRPVLQRLQALRGIVEQERDALFMEERRALRARERTQVVGQPVAPEQTTPPKRPKSPDQATGADQTAPPEPPLTKAAGVPAASQTQYSPSSDGRSTGKQTPTS